MAENSRLTISACWRSTIKSLMPPSTKSRKACLKSAVVSGQRSLGFENYPNIRKVLYLDVPPNLYIGTQYLKVFYGDRIRDYRETRSLSTIQFSNDKEIEIIAIAPWQLSQVSAQFDIFHNAHSFVEMPQEMSNLMPDKRCGYWQKRGPYATELRLFRP